MARKDKTRGAAGWLFAVLALAIIAVGAGFAYAATQGLLMVGTAYGVAVGVALVLAGVLLIANHAAGIWLFGLLAIVAMVWSARAVGLDGDALLPRLGWITVIGVLLFVFWPVARRLLAPVGRIGYVGATLGLGVIAAGLIAVSMSMGAGA
ncbi:hypothetical protein [Pseudomonas sp. Marseille-QA0892]